MSITALPTPPQRTDSPDVFVSKSDAFVAALPQLVTDINNTAAGINVTVAGGVYAIPYTFDSATAAADPGNGKLRFNQAAQNTATALYADSMGSDSTDWSALLDNIQACTSSTKGVLKLMKMGDATKWITFAISSITNLGGYRTIACTVISYSAASPFAAGDSLVMQIARTGDKGDRGNDGTNGSLTRRIYSVASDTAPSLNVTSYDQQDITALAGNITIGAPAGTPTNGQNILFRIRDNGTARTIAYNAVFRAPTELAFPASTVAGKWTYLGFMYNVTDAKWDLIAALSNM